MKSAVTYAVGRQTAWLTSKYTFPIAKAIETAGCKSRWDNTRKGYGVPIAALDDVLAALQAAGVPTVEQLG